MRDQSLLEEIANSVSHGIGLLAAIVGIPFLIIHSMQYGDTRFVVGTSVFAATVVILYISSTIYHAVPIGKYKRIFKVIDHSAIYLLIAGTYTPFTLGALRGTWGWTLFAIVWSIALVGVTLKFMGKASHPMLSTILYLLMGWVIVIAIKPLISKVPTAGLIWLIAGGLFYTAGVIFFATDSRLKYGHFIWHLFVLAGTICHFFAVFWYAI